MEKITRAVEYAEYLVQTAKQRPESLCRPSSSNKPKSIHQKLQELYIESCQNQDHSKDIVLSSNLLSKLVRRDKLNCLVLKLYPGNEGYSIMLRGRGGVELETLKLPYEVSELLDFVDSSELPPFLVDLLEKAQMNVFYSGCVILEVRDYRRSITGSYDTQYVLLKPTPQSLLSDMYNIINDGHRWTQEDQFALESQLLLATEEPLCLDPSPSVFLVNNKLQYEQKSLSNPMLKRSARRYNQAALNRKRKLASAAAPKELKLHDFIHKKKPKSNPPVNLRVGKPHVDMWKQKPLQLSAPESVEVAKFATVIPASDPGSDNSFETVEEITLERDVSTEKKILAKLTIQKRKSEDEFYGELYLDHDYREGSVGTSCTFLLGTRILVDKYLEQFKEIFTEEGRRAVKITTQKPGQPPNVEYTQTSQTPTTPGIGPAGPQGILSAHAPALTAAIKGQFTQADLSTTSSSGLTAKRNVPIQLSLTLAPVAQGAQPTANQLQLNIQKSQPQQVGLRGKPLSQVAGQRVSSSTPSPATTPTSVPIQGQLFSPSLVPSPVSSQNSKGMTSLSSPPVSVPSRKSSTEGTTVQQINQGIPQGNITFVQNTDCSSSTQSGQQQNIANINITNIGLPPNINIQNLSGLPGVNIANLQSLQNMQVSLTGVSMPGGGIAVPVPISLINTNSGVIQNQNVFVSSLPSGSLSSTTTGSVPVSTSSSVGSAPTLVTMVTSMPTTITTSSVTSSSSSSLSSPGVVTSESASNPSTVITASGGLLSPIIGLAPFVQGGVKSQAGSSIRQPSSVPLLQIQGQSGIQLVGLPQQRAPGKSGSGVMTSQSGGKPVSTLPTTVQLTAQNISGHQLATLSQFKPNTPQGGAVPQQQLLQLQHLPYKQLQQIQIRQPQVATSTSASKSKNKKRTTPTPPKQ
ncbi:transcription factor SPT20 homolog isoform X2 [Ostrea edulis]|uniref:transcription factor SPT20 homolog isoform X2 n=1 Tax=Ostrea edulis TaxID=37623 RepID=UPI0024AF0BEF|nr:transcription factor SPT20 homolog isoform X2 [Ostrea edulis]